MGKELLGNKTSAFLAVGAQTHTVLSKILTEFQPVKEGNWNNLVDLTFMTHILLDKQSESRRLLLIQDGRLLAKQNMGTISVYQMSCLGEY
jgi:hypothetical protein